MIGRSDVLEGASLACFALIAGSAFLFTSYAKDAFPPATLTLLRLSIGSTALLLTNVLLDGLRSVRAAGRSEVLSLALVGFANTAIPYTLFAAALGEGVGVGVAAALTGAAPLFAAIASAVLIPGALRRLAVPHKLVGLVIGFCGVVMIALHKEAIKKHKDSSGTGILLQCLGVASKALAAVLAQKHNERFGKSTTLTPLSQAFLQASAGAALALLISLSLDCSGSTPHTLDPKGLVGGSCYSFFSDSGRADWASLMYLALCSSCAVYVIQFFLVRRVGAVRQLLVDYCTPVVGVVEGAVFKGDWDAVSTAEVVLFVCGALLATAGVAVLHWPVAGKDVLQDEDAGDSDCEDHSSDPLLPEGQVQAE